MEINVLLIPFFGLKILIGKKEYCSAQKKYFYSPSLIDARFCQTNVQNNSFFTFGLPFGWYSLSYGCIHIGEGVRIKGSCKKWY